jgi:CRP-like cAMP-binding protein
MSRTTETLARIPLFRSLSSEETARLDTQCIWRRAKERETILDYKDEGSDIYFVTRGEVRVLIRPVSGRTSVFRTIRDGEYFGELAAIDGRPRSAAIVAMTDAVIAKMSPRVLRETVHRHSDVCDQLLASLVAEIRTLANRVNEFSVLDVPTRIRSELLRLARKDGGDGLSVVISPPPTHAELAARVSAGREAVTRELNKLKRDGLLETRRGAIVLLDPRRLSQSVEKAME